MSEFQYKISSLEMREDSITQRGMNNLSWHKTDTVDKERPQNDEGVLLSKSDEPLEGRYEIIYADPPWSYSNKSTRSSAQDNYSTMTIEDIKNLHIENVPVRDIAKENSALFLWTTGPFSREAYSVIKAWGFTFKTYGFIWGKTNKNGSLYMGMGNYTRANVEMCLLGIRGKFPVVAHNIINLHLVNRLKHSEKPPYFRNQIEKLYGEDKSKIEIFARDIPHHWDGWGNQVTWTSMLW